MLTTSFLATESAQARRRSRGERSNRHSLGRGRDLAVSDANDILGRVLRSRVVAIIRGSRLGDVRSILSALSEGGISAVEVAMNSEGALEAIELAREEFSDRFVVGAGTVLDPLSARAAILAGAEFLLSPVLSESVIEICHRYSKLAVPGVLSPSEVSEALRLGCRIVKIFPATIFGPQYVRDIKQLFPGVHLMPVGGVSLDNVSLFMRSGAAAVGVGSQLVNMRWVSSGDFARIVDTAAAFCSRARHDSQDSMQVSTSM
jgi:2-dehydro-3-deoxyphosphogluconate aldolase/(4S)-4-hydroxy-2-oxoglutarate aldolase